MSGLITYPWQQTMLDAFTTFREELPSKINAAEKAIAARLIDKSQPDVHERIALNDALRALRVLVEETKPTSKRASQNKDIA
jgi:hypothetical protein